MTIEEVGKIVVKATKTLTNVIEYKNWQEVDGKISFLEAQAAIEGKYEAGHILKKHYEICKKLFADKIEEFRQKDDLDRLIKSTAKN